MEIVAERAAQARARGIEVVEADLNQRLSFASESFDVVHANQVIEHLAAPDILLSEIFRILKPNGIAIISTENGSSWHNIGAAILGWQIFSLTNFSTELSGIGNPLALHRFEKVTLGSWSHKIIFNYRGLKEFFEIHGIQDIAVSGAGYYPLPACLPACLPVSGESMCGIPIFLQCVRGKPLRLKSKQNCSGIRLRLCYYRSTW